jgi:hypothetical protein
MGHTYLLWLAFAALLASAQDGDEPIITLAADVMCPTGWQHFTHTDECYRYWTTVDWNRTVSVRRTYDEAVETCKMHHAELPVVKNATQFAFILDTIGRKTGRQAWLQIRDAPTNRLYPQVWMTNRGRVFDDFFDWDARRSMPGPEPCAAVQLMGEPARRIVGGTDKMITVDCYERLGVLCVKPRRPVSIGGVNLTRTGMVQHVWGTDLYLTFVGGNIPVGTRVTLQTTDENFFATAAPHSPTNCSMVVPLHGPSQSVHLGISHKSYTHKLCNGTCDEATFYLPSTAGLALGAKYSFCFFLPQPFDAPKDKKEYGLNLLPGVFLQEIQKRSEYLTDVCVRHQNSVQLFMGAGRDDRGRDIHRPYYFSSPHEN